MYIPDIEVYFSQLEINRWSLPAILCSIPHCDGFHIHANQQDKGFLTTTMDRIFNPYEHLLQCPTVGDSRLNIHDRPIHSSKTSNFPNITKSNDNGILILIFSYSTFMSMHSTSILLLQSYNNSINSVLYKHKESSAALKNSIFPEFH